MGASYCGYETATIIGVGIEKEHESNVSEIMWQRPSTHEAPLVRKRTTSVVSGRSTLINNDYAVSNKMNHEKNVLYATHNVHTTVPISSKFQAFFSVPRKDRGPTTDSSLSVSQRIEFDPNNDYSDSSFFEYS